jgi:hypothetical protein
VTYVEFKTEVFRRVAAAKVGLKGDRAQPTGRSWAEFDAVDLARALNELRAEGRILCTNGVWYVRGQRPVFGGAR